MMTKTAHADLAQKIAPIDRADTENAFEYGFIKMASDCGATKEQLNALYEHGLRVLTAPK